MALAFDFFFSLAALMVLSGGAIIRAPHIYLDLASVDTFAIVALTLLLLGRKSIPARSRVFQLTLRAFSSEDSIVWLKRFFIFCFAMLFISHVAKHWALQTDGFDVSFVHQALFNPFRGPFFPADISVSGSALGEHVLLSLIPLSLITQFIRIDEFIFLIQVSAIAVPLFFLFFRSPLARSLKAFSILPVLILLANSSLRNALLFDFREDTFAFLGLFLAAMCCMRGFALGYIASLLLAITSKEHVFLIAIFFVPALLWSDQIRFDFKKRLWLSALTVFICIAYGIFAFKFLIPYFNPVLNQGASPIVFRLRQFGSTPAEILKNILFHPINWVFVIQNVFTKNALLYLAKMLIPLTPFIFYKEAALLFLPAFAGIGLNVLTGFAGQVSMQFHYDLVNFPFVALALCVGVQESMAKGFLAKPVTQIGVKLLAVILVALSFSNKWPTFELTHFFPSVSEVEARIALLKLDRNVPIASGSRFSAQVNQHIHLYVLGDQCAPYSKRTEADFKGYILFDPVHPGTTQCLSKTGEIIFQNPAITIYRN